jgi:hypothetical protein
MRGLLLVLRIGSPVDTDCLGLPESGVVYEVNSLWRECRAVATGRPVCSTFQVQFMQEETSCETVIGSPDPPVRSGYWYLIPSRDGAENWSDDCVE